MPDEIQPDPGKGEPKHEQHDTTPQPAQIASPVASAVKALKAHGPESGDGSTADQDERKRQKTLEKIAKIQAWCSAALVLFSLGQVVVWHWQWSATRDQYCAMVEQNGITRDQLNLTRDTASTQLRAYIDLVIEPETRLHYSADTGSFGVILKLKNFGQTPAYKVVVRGDMPYEPADTVPKCDPKALAEADGPMTVAPGRDWSVFLHCPLTKAQQATFGNDGLAAWPIIRVDYFDAFGGERHTEVLLKQGAPHGPGEFNLLIMESDSN